jgi:integrase
MGSIARRADRKRQWRARYRDEGGTEHSKSFTRRIDAQRWLAEEEAKLTTGMWTSPKTARTTVAEWADEWLTGFQGRPSTRVAAAAQVKRIKAEFGHLTLKQVRSSQVKTWMVKLRAEGLSAGYISNLHGRLAQLFTDAVEDGLIPKSPCSKRTAPKGAPRRAFVATTKQVWALHDVMPPYLRAAVLLGAFAGLRAGEACGLRPGDVDFAARMIRPAVQWPAEPLKTEIAHTAIPVPQSLLDDLLAHMARWPGETVLVSRSGGQLPKWTLERAIVTARAAVPGLPEDFRFHDLRHYFASMLIHSGMDVITVQARVRHEDAATTLRVYGHLFPGRDDPTRDAIDAVFRAHAAPVRPSGDA